MRQKNQPDNGLTAAASGRLTLARFGAAHGVQGEVRLKSFTEDPMAVASYGPLESADGRQFIVTDTRRAAGKALDMLVVRIKGVTDRGAAEALNGIELSVPRDRLPDADLDDFYYADLIGLTAETLAGEALGTVTAIHNHGAGDLLEVARAVGIPALIPFTRQIVPKIDVQSGKIVIDPPDGLLDQEEQS